MNKAYTFRLNPTEEQTESIKQHAGSTRWLWNQMLPSNIERYDQEQKFNFRFDMNKATTNLRQEHDWLSEVPTQVLQQKNRDRDLDLALKNRVGTTRIHGYGDTYDGDMLKDMSSYVSKKYQNPVVGLEATRR